MKSTQWIDKVLREFPVPISITDKHGNILLKNSRLKQLCGYEDEDLKEDTVEEFTKLIYPDEKYRKEILTEYQARVNKALDGAPFEPMRVRITCKDGQIRFVEFKQEIVDEHLIGVWTDLTVYRRFEGTFKELAGSTSHQFGKKFFEIIALELSDILRADYLNIGKLEGVEPELEIHGVVWIKDGQLRSPSRYKLEGTPCQNVIGKRTCSYSSGVASKFPEDTWLTNNSIQGYIGTPLFGSSGKPVGIIVALFRSPIEELEFSELILQVLAPRVASEFERAEAEDELQVRLDELQRWHSVTLNREERIHDLKSEVNDLLKMMGKERRYFY